MTDPVADSSTLTATRTGVRPEGRTEPPGPAARIGIGGPVGSGKTAMVEKLIPRLENLGKSVSVITNDLVTSEDAVRLRRSGIIDADRVLAVEAGACPHTVIREDPTMNMEAAEQLDQDFPGTDVILIESGGDNLASTFSDDLVDFWVFVIDVSGGGDIPRKRGPGVLRADVLVINKADLAPHVGVDLELMVTEARDVREGRPVLVTNCFTGEGVDEFARFISDEVLF